MALYDLYHVFFTTKDICIIYLKIAINLREREKQFDINTFCLRSSYLDIYNNNYYYLAAVGMVACVTSEYLHILSFESQR